MAAFEAARWAPSSMNAQPWRFIYARRGSSEWQALFDSTLDRTQLWLKNAAVIVYVVSNNRLKLGDKEVPSPTYGFDAGAACENFMLQISKSGYASHAAGSFDREKARATLGLPETYDPFCVIGVGKQGDKSILPPALAEREFPSGRLPVSEIALEGRFRP
jgi:nitroreductase